MNYIPTHSPEEARRILDLLKKEDERAAKKAKKDAEEKLKQQYANDKKYTRAEMIADIKRQISSSNEKAKHAFDIIWGKQTADERRNMFTVEENGMGFSKYDMKFYGKLFKKVLNNEKLSDYEWKKFRDVMVKYAGQLWQNARNKYQKVGQKYVVRKTLAEQVLGIGGELYENWFLKESY